MPEMLMAPVKTLREYERVRPAEANPLDSMGDVSFYWGRFAEAEQFYREAYKKDAAFLNGGSLIKAATSHLFTGDANGAEAVFSEYEQARRAANDPLIDLTRASWDHLRGNRNADWLPGEIRSHHRRRAISPHLRIPP